MDGRMRSGSTTQFMSASIISAIFINVCFMVTSVPGGYVYLFALDTFGACYCEKSRQVSLTKLKSRVGDRSPTFISRTPLAIWVIIVGIMARALWRGP